MAPINRNGRKDKNLRHTPSWKDANSKMPQRMAAGMYTLEWVKSSEAQPQPMNMPSARMKRLVSHWLWMNL